MRLSRKYRPHAGAAAVGEMQRHPFDTEPLPAGSREGDVIVNAVLDARDTRRTVDQGVRRQVVATQGVGQLHAVAATAESVAAVVHGVASDIDLIEVGRFTLDTDIRRPFATSRDQSGDPALYVIPQNATIEAAPASKPSAGKRPTLPYHPDRLRRRAIVVGLCALLVVFAVWLIPVLGFILTILAVRVLHGIIAPEPIDSYVDEYFDPHRHSRW